MHENHPADIGSALPRISLVRADSAPPDLYLVGGAR